MMDTIDIFDMDFGYSCDAPTRPLDCNNNSTTTSSSSTMMSASSNNPQNMDFWMPFANTDRKQDESHAVESNNSLEPTPISPNGVVVVRELPFTAFSWHDDKAFMDSLKSLLIDEGNDDGQQSDSQARWGNNQEKNHASFQASHCKIEPAFSNNAETSSTHQGGVLPNQTSQQQQRRRWSSAEQSKLFGSFGNYINGFFDSEDDSTTTTTTTATTNGTSVSRSSHSEHWKLRYQELVKFQKEYGHCLVPLNWPANPSLAHWVKRQRYLFRVKREGKHSTLTDERQRALACLGFVWDSHAAGWEERWNELREFKEHHGHCNVPKNYPENQQLAVWVKCQRRQFKLFSVGENSNMTKARIEKLQILGFVFDPRSKRRTSICSI